MKRTVVREMGMTFRALIVKLPSVSVGLNEALNLRSRTGRRGKRY